MPQPIDVQHPFDRLAEAPCHLRDTHDLQSTPKDEEETAAPGLVHSAQTKNASMYGGWRSSGRHASTDRMGCRIGEVELAGMSTLRDAVPLAVPPLHGHCVDGA